MSNRQVVQVKDQVQISIVFLLEGGAAAARNVGIHLQEVLV
jgi:hypothetical protein